MASIGLDLTSPCSIALEATPFRCRIIILSVDHDARAIDRRICLAQGRDDAITASLDRSEIDEEDLIIAMINDLAERMAAAHQVGRCELALEDGVLKMVTEVAHRFEHLAEPLFVADVVADEIGVAHIAASLYSLIAANNPRP